jgi:hypothetical protein
MTKPISAGGQPAGWRPSTCSSMGARNATESSRGSLRFIFGGGRCAARSFRLQITGAVLGTRGAFRGKCLKTGGRIFWSGSDCEGRISFAARDVHISRLCLGREIDAHARRTKPQLSAGLWGLNSCEEVLCVPRHDRAARREVRGRRTPAPGTAAARGNRSGGVPAHRSGTPAERGQHRGPQGETPMNDRSNSDSGNGSSWFCGGQFCPLPALAA